MFCDIHTWWNKQKQKRWMNEILIRWKTLNVMLHTFRKKIIKSSEKYITRKAYVKWISRIIQRREEKKYQLLKHYLVQILSKWEKPLKEKPLQILNERFK